MLSANFQKKFRPKKRSLDRYKYPKKLIWNFFIWNFKSTGTKGEFRIFEKKNLIFYL
jgi:hypothetical protein